ncbi:MAG: LacI family DNA-binding transcriptional regulator [Deinococcota bacterium]
MSKQATNVTIKDVAKCAGVSYATVSRVINGQSVSEDKKARVMQAIDKLGYVVNMSARSLAGGNTHIVGVLVPNLGNEYINQVLQGIDEALREYNYDLMLYTTQQREDKEARYVQALSRGMIDGLLLLVPFHPEAYLKSLRARHFPHVVIDQVVIDQNEHASASPTVAARNRQGALEAMRYLLELGHRRIGFIKGLAQLGSAHERFLSYEQALQDYGLSIDEDLIQEGHFEQRQGFLAAQALLSLPNPPTAIFAANDVSSIGVLQAARHADLRVPKDLSIVGFDDIPRAAHTYPALTTVHQPLVEMGRTAVSLLLRYIERPEQAVQHISFDTHLIVRDTCASANNKTDSRQSVVEEVVSIAKTS